MNLKINKNISVWRGNNTPPTEYHLWIKNDNEIYIFNGEEWVNVHQDISTGLESIYEILYQQYSKVTLSSNKTIIEKGVLTDITISWKITFNDQIFTPNSVQLKYNNSILVDSVSETSYSEQISNSKKYDLQVTFPYNVNKQTSITVNAYYPMYFGPSTKDSIQEVDVLAFTKQNIKSSPAGNYSMEVSEGQYVWLCIPSTMNINKVTSSGFDVPMENPLLIPVTNKDTYKCYRSSNSFTAGTFNFTIN